MEELVELVSKKTGIPKEQAQTAVETVIDYLKKELPAPIAGQLDNVLEGGGISGLTKGLGGLLGQE